MHRVCKSRCMATDAELTTAAECAARWAISPSTARRYLAHVDPVDRDPATGAMRYRRVDADAARAALPGRGARTDKRPSALDGEAVRRLLADETLPVRDRALWALLANPLMPVRVADALTVTVDDVSPDEKVALVSDSRGGRRVVPLTDRIAGLVQDVAKGKSAGARLFSDGAGRPMTRYSAGRAAGAAGVSLHDFPPHSLRSREELTAERVPVGDLRAGDVVYLGGVEVLGDGTLRGVGDVLVVRRVVRTGPGALADEAPRHRSVSVTAHVLDASGSDAQPLVGVGTAQVAIVARHHFAG